MEEILKFLEKRRGKGAQIFEIKRIFGNSSEEKLKELQRKRKIVEIRKNHFIALRKTPFLIGNVYFKGKDLFVETIEGEFFFSSNPLKLMEGDTVLLKKERGYVRVFKIIERTSKRLIGFYPGDKNFVPIKRLREEFQLNKQLNLPYGSIIETEIIFYPQKKRKGVLSFKNYLGRFGNTKEEIYSFCLSENLPFDFTEEVRKEANYIKENFDENKRLDLTKEEIFTIDPEDAKDFDDAISLREEKEYLILGVHIADVTSYLEENSAIDREAFLRAETLYFPSYAVHMLPEKLSENLCSLREKEKKYVISVFIYFDKKGKHLKTEIKESIILSKKRFTYEEVEEILKGKKNKFSNTLKKMEELATILKEKRMKKGGLEFEFQEFKLEYDKEGNLKGVLPLEKLKSHSIVEEFMLYANKEVARFLWNKNYPLLFRIHPKPDPLRLLDLKVLCQKWGINFPVNVDEPTPKMVQKILEEWKKLKDGEYLQQLLLKSLPRAIYSSEKDLHFALNFQHYCHFTSPIRRYADIIVHRSLKNALKGKKYENNKLKEIAEHLNNKAIKKEEIERDFLEYKILQLLKGKEGKVLDGVITSVIESGFFVFLPDYFISGFLPFSSFKEIYFIADKTNQRARDVRGRYNFKIMDEVKVKIESIDPFKRFLNLVFVKKN